LQRFRYGSLSTDLPPKAFAQQLYKTPPRESASSSKSPASVQKRASP
jgi:hypothetical protein